MIALGGLLLWAEQHWQVITLIVGLVVGLVRSEVKFRQAVKDSDKRLQTQEESMIRVFQELETMHHPPCVALVRVEEREAALNREVAILRDEYATREGKVLEELRAFADAVTTKIEDEVAKLGDRLRLNGNSNSGQNK